MCFSVGGGNHLNSFKVHAEWWELPLPLAVAVYGVVFHFVFFGLGLDVIGLLFIVSFVGGAFMHLRGIFRSRIELRERGIVIAYAWGEARLEYGQITGLDTTPEHIVIKYGPPVPKFFGITTGSGHMMQISLRVDQPMVVYEAIRDPRDAVVGMETDRRPMTAAA